MIKRDLLVLKDGIGKMWNKIYGFKGVKSCFFKLVLEVFCFISVFCSYSLSFYHRLAFVFPILSRYVT